MFRPSESDRARQYVNMASMKVEKKKFDNALAKLLQAKPKPRKKIKTQGKHGKKKAIIQPSENTNRKN